ncbi:MAG: hemolysin III family protein [Clostridia bacterium]|nr:hemolysin III family protein [Clostridia bacterium]
MTNVRPCDKEYVDYTVGEEIVNTASHFVGALFGAAALVLCCGYSLIKHDTYMLVGCLIYGISLILLYSVSSVYHGLPKCFGKKIMRIVDHCTIYLLIAGTYTPVIMAIRRFSPSTALILMLFVWGVSIVAAVFTAIDFVKYSVFSMICYITVGWCILAFIGDAMTALTSNGFSLMLTGGILYTVGAILYGIGSKVRYFHSIFHIFVLAGSVFQFFSIFLYAI